MSRFFFDFYHFFLENGVLGLFWPFLGRLPEIIFFDLMILL